MADDLLQRVKDAARDAALAEQGGAQGDGVVSCLFCGEAPPKFYSDAGRREFGITGQCEFCFDEACTEDEERCAVCEHPLSWHAHGRAGACAEFTAR